MLPKLLKEVPGVEIETIGFNHDQMHMIMVIPPRYSISEVMGKLKSQSASVLRKKFPWFKNMYWKESIVRSAEYCISSVRVDEGTIPRYVECHGKKDSGQLQMEL
ncbi:MAG: transposase [Spirochaetia bacterium]|nr:transposase [Spirochaetia bacterium]